MEDAIRIEVEMLLNDFRLETAALAELVRGPVMNDLVRRAIRVEAAAKRIASERSPSPPGHGPGVVTGRLRGSITYRLGVDSVSPYVDIGTAVEYAPYLELGTRRMAARPFLRPALQAARVSDGGSGDFTLNRTRFI